MAENKPTATAQEVVQMSDAELTVYAKRLHEYGINHPQKDLEFITSNLKVTRQWLRETPRTDASLMMRCELFNITL